MSNISKSKAFSNALYKAKLRSRKRSVEFNLDLEYIKELYDSQKGLCFYSGAPLMIIGDENKTIDEYKMTIDCIIPSKGYIRGNVVWCIYAVNSFKLNLSTEEMLNLCKKIIKNMEK